MFWRQKKYLYIIFGMVFSVSFLVTYLVANLINGGLKKPELNPEATGKTRLQKPIITKNTVVKEEIKYLCGTKQQKEIPAKELEGLDYQGLQAKFPPEDGWFIDDTIPNMVTIFRQVEDFCPKHGAFRHLGLDHNYLAVYQGPLGYDQVILSRENIPVDILPRDFQKKLNLAAEFNRQPEKIKEELREFLEFTNELKLNEAMQNFDEYRE